MLIALAGRRVDQVETASPRFPAANVTVVSKRIREVLQTQHAQVLVTSAACGADLLALFEAGALGIRRRIVLPYDRAKFRETSVVDRPGPWGPLYDRILDEVERRGDLLVLSLAQDCNPYAASNRAILDEAQLLAHQSGQPANAVVVWDGTSRGQEDLTQAFRDEAIRRGLKVCEVSTL